MIRVGINGFGRIGRAFFRAAMEDSDIEVVAINDLGDLSNLAYLLKYDTVYGTLKEHIAAENGQLVAGDKRVHVTQEKDPTKLPWGSLNIDIVVESTGVFDDYEKASAHLTAGAKRVVISAPVKGDSEHGALVLVGLNEDKLANCQISSNASCTTNAGSPIIAILDEKLGIEKAVLNTVHAYTATQSIVDSPAKGSDMRRGRAGAQNITPSSTGAAIAVTKAYKELEGKFDGIAMRVPVVAGSIVDITFIAKRETSTDEVNQMLEESAREERWNGVYGVTREQLVSSDIVDMHASSLVDLNLTRVVGGNLVKVMAWYDNEMGYVQTLMRHIKSAAKHINK
ncbi:MAG TPA: type I glyceraldehyde-3-phosphate dehydrogenase [Candidatus Paceibacterota bacterium]|nr:type I glyceraldehyde-3-phosphate dehydrogenase [Candidatus Paceibacterota bacterium]